jgi:hypothetical protein
MKILNFILVSLLVTGCGGQPAAHTGGDGESPDIPANQKMEREAPAGGDDENTAAGNQQPPAVDELIAAMGNPLNEKEEMIVGKYLEGLTSTANPGLYAGDAPSETINRGNRTYSILYDDGDEKTLVHGIWMIQGNDYYYMGMIANGVPIPKEEREVYHAVVVTLDKEKSVFSVPSPDDPSKQDHITWKSIEKFNAAQMQAFNDDAVNEDFNIFEIHKGGFPLPKVTP